MLSSFSRDLPISSDSPKFRLSCFSFQFLSETHSPKKCVVSVVITPNTRTCKYSISCLFYSANILYSQSSAFIDIPSILTSHVPQQRVVPYTKLTIGKRSCLFPMTAPTIWNQFPITVKVYKIIIPFLKNERCTCVKSSSHATCPAVPCSNYDTSDSRLL